jgi:hypothetical protein
VNVRRRVAKLYKPHAGQYFLCRHCRDLNYCSSNESGDVHFTARRQTARAARKLGLVDPEDVYTIRVYNTCIQWIGPMGCISRTFQRLRQDAIDAIEREHWTFGIVLHKIAQSFR